MRYTVILFMAMAITATVCAAPVSEERVARPRTRVSANPDDLLAHEDSSEADAVNRHFVLNNEDYSQFIKIIDGETGLVAV
jgi:hypothetical protein